MNKLHIYHQHREISVLYWEREEVKEEHIHHNTLM